MPFFKKKRSQVDAPMELVVAIIILLASLSLAFLIMKQVISQRCIAEVKSEVYNLQAAMQDLALQSPPSKRSVIFRMPTCGDERVDLIRFVHYSDPIYCKLCPGHTAGCWKLELASYDPQDEVYITDDLRQAEVCVDVAGELELKDESTEQGNPLQCEPLSSSPCPMGFSKECNFETSGKPKSVYDPDELNSPSRWQTLGRQSLVYEIILRKGFSSGGKCTTASCPAISICARPLKK
ncbi:MAG: hypothetical protein AABX01_01045 [Candidatus Micrarchaeota archaeon]